MKEYFSYLGVACFKQKKYEKARDAFRSVIALDKGSAIDLANLGMCEKMLGDAESAREHLEGAVEIDPGIEFARKALDELGPGDTGSAAKQKDGEKPAE